MPRLAAWFPQHRIVLRPLAPLAPRAPLAPPGNAAPPAPGGRVGTVTPCCWMCTQVAATVWDFERRPEGWRAVNRVSRLMDGGQEARVAHVVVAGAGA